MATTPWFLKSTRNESDDIDCDLSDDADTDAIIDALIKTATKDQLAVIMRKTQDAKRFMKPAKENVPYRAGRDRFHIVRSRTQKPYAGVWLMDDVPHHSWYFLKVENSGFAGAAQCEMCYRPIQFTYRITHVDMGHDEPLYVCEHCAAWAIRDGPDTADDDCDVAMSARS